MKTNWAAFYQSIDFISADSIKRISLLNTNDNTVLNVSSSLALNLGSDENKQEDCIKISMACKSHRSWEVNTVVFHRGKQGQMSSINDHFVFLLLKIN